VKKGNKGKKTKSALWNPVSIAIALYEKEVLIYKKVQILLIIIKKLVLNKQI
jgi:hypothetical protein